jgi:hypothetical protein
LGSGVGGIIADSTTGSAVGYDFASISPKPIFGVAILVVSCTCGKTIELFVIIMLTITKNNTAISSERISITWLWFNFII